MLIHARNLVNICRRHNSMKINIKDREKISNLRNIDLIPFFNDRGNSPRWQGRKKTWDVREIERERKSSINARKTYNLWHDTLMQVINLCKLPASAFPHDCWKSWKLGKLIANRFDARDHELAFDKSRFLRNYDRLFTRRLQYVYAHQLIPHFSHPLAFTELHESIKS